MSLLIIVLSLAKGLELPCDPAVCPEEWVSAMQRGDGWCDPECNTVFCGFDSVLGQEADMQSSDCFIQCQASMGCSLSSALQKSYCTQFYYTCIEDLCGWTYGKCGYCNFNCTWHPGFQEDLGDGDCKEECNTALCAFDAGDCVLLTQGFCATGCYAEMLGDGTCQPECLNEACNLDAGDCDLSLCSAGCYPYMIDDGKCEESCHVEACLWDGSDCDCSPGCTLALLSNDECDWLCATEGCDFDNGRCGRECSPGCSDTMRGDGVCDSECFHPACEHDNGDCECAPGCLYSDIGQCKPECSVPECNYGMSNLTAMLCQGAVMDCEDMKCSSTVNSCVFTCEQCGYALQYWMNCCTGCCVENYTPHPAFRNVCVRAPDHTSELHPRVIYVGSGTVSGTASSPYPTLSAAFSSIFEKYVEVRLLPGVHPLSVSKYLIGGTVFGSIKNLAPQVASLKRMKITSQSCVERPVCERAVILSTNRVSRPYFTFSGNRYFEVKNVDFESSLPQKLCVSNGRWDCLGFADLFIIQDSAVVTFENITFRHFYNSVTSILFVNNSTLMLRNTEFIDIMLTGEVTGRSLLTLINANVNYTHGCVSLINNQWDYDTLMESSGAITAISSKLAISGVAFTHNFMALAERSSMFASLIHLRDCWQVRISNCEFAFNVGRVGAVISVFTYKWNATSRDYGTAKEIMDSSIEVANCTFRNNTGTIGTSVYVYFLGAQQRVLITNCTFLNEFAEENTIVFGSSLFPRPVLSKVRKAVTLNEAERTVEYSLPRFTLSHSLFRNCNVGLFGLVILERLADVWVEDVAVNGIAAGDARNATTNSLGELVTIPGTHIPKYAPSSSPQQCQFLLSINSSIVVELKALTIAHSNCSRLVVISHATARFRESHFGWNRGTANSGFVVYVMNSTIAVWDVLLEGNVNANQYSQGSFYLANSVANITNSNFTLNAVSEGGALYLDSVQSAEIRSCRFEHNSADMGGAVFIASSSSMNFRVFSSVFWNNSAESYGGGIYVTVAPRQISLKLTLEYSVFEQCRSKIGSAIHTSAGVVFLPGTHFKDCQFIDNVSTVHGIFVLEQVRGEASLTRTQFSRNASPFNSVLSIVYSHAQSTHLLSLTDILFDANQATTVVSVSSPASLLLVTGSAVDCRSNAGTCLYFEYVKFACAGCQFERNTAVSGAALQLYYSQAECENCKFQSNSVEFTGGAVLVKSYSLFACHDCLFENNTSQWQGGALFTEQQSTLLLDTADFTYNAAHSGGSAFFLVLSDTQSLVRFSRFSFNAGTNYGCVNLISTVLSLIECNFTENSSVDLMGGLVMSQSVAFIDSCKFANQTGVSGVFIYAVSSDVTISNTLFCNGTATNTGSGIALFSSLAQISHCSFEILEADFGAAVAVQDNSSLSVHNSTFSDINSSAINHGVFAIIRSSLSLSNSSVLAYKQRGIDGLQANITVVGSSFVDGTGTLGSGVTCINCEAVTIRQCLFKHLAADRGAGVYLEGSGSFDIANSNFLLCQGVLSGAVYITESLGNITNCSFFGNAGDRGGAIHIEKSVDRSSSIVIADNQFDGNSAIRRGGAICWEGTQPTLEGNRYSNNHATYGPDIASYAAKVSTVLESHSVLANVTSGKPLVPPLAFELLDVYGQVVADNNESTAQVTTDDNETAVSGEVRVQARSGRFVFTGCSIVARPGSNTSISVITSAVAKREQVQVSMRYCVKGENQVNNVCVPCAPGTYSLTNHSGCSNCPAKMICLGNFTIAPKPGYWRSSPDTDTVFKCPNAEACLGSLNGTSPTGLCADGYEGMKCQSCARGYYQWGAIHCSKCWNFPTRIGVHAFVSVLLVTTIGVLVGLVLSSKFELVLYIRIFMHYTQVVMLFKSSGLAWSNQLFQLFRAYEVFGAFPEYLVSANCMMDSFYNKVLAASVSHPALVSLALLIWGFPTLLSRPQRFLQRQFVSTSVVLCFLANPSVLRTLFEPFRCVEVDQGDYWLQEQNLRCWTPQHAKYAFGLCLPCLILYGLAAPALLLVLMLRKSCESERFMYLTAGYSKQCWYWEFAILFWKELVIACLALLLPLSELFPALSAFAVMVVGIGVIRTRKPFQQAELNSLEAQSLYLCTATLYIGLVLNSEVLGHTTSIVLSVVTLAGNAVFSARLAWRAGGVLYHYIRDRNHRESP